MLFACLVNDCSSSSSSGSAVRQTCSSAVRRTSSSTTARGAASYFAGWPRQLCSELRASVPVRSSTAADPSRVVPDLVLCARRRNHSRFQPVFSSPLGSLRQPRLLYLGSSFSSFSFPHAVFDAFGRHTFLFLSSCGEVVNYHKAVQRTAFKRWWTSTRASPCVSRWLSRSFIAEYIVRLDGERFGQECG